MKTEARKESKESLTEITDQTRRRTRHLQANHGTLCGTAGRWSAILGAVLLALGVSTWTSAADDEARVSIMTQNMDAGTDLGFAVALGAPLGVDLTLAEIQASHIPERAELLAAKIAAEQPHLVALEEATLWRVGPTPETATEVLYDQLDLLLSALANQGAAYEVVVVNTLTDLALPGTVGALRYTDRDVLLIRADLGPPAFHLSDVHAQLFDTVLNFQGLPVAQGWLSADVHLGNSQVRLAVTHLQSPVPGVPEATDVQVAQAAELVQALRNLAIPVVVCGDFNSDANFGSGVDATPSVALIEAAGYADVWRIANPTDPGATWPLYLEDQTPPDFFAPSSPTERIDLFFSQDLQIISAKQVRAPAPTGSLPSYGSDHAGVIATFQP